MNSTESVIPIRNNAYEGWPTRWGFAATHPQKLPVSCGAYGIHNGESCKFDALPQLSFGQASIRKNRRGEFCVQTGILRFRSGVERLASPISILLLGITITCPWTFSRRTVWHYRRFDFSGGDALAEELNFSRAAARLRIDQSTLSKRMPSLNLRSTCAFRAGSSDSGTDRGRTAFCGRCA